MLRLLACAATFAAACVPAQALDVTFTGTVANTCSLALATPGLLAMSSDGQTLGSDQIGGAPATVNIISIGVNTITVDAPALTSSPAGYDPVGQTIEVGYAGTAALAGIVQSLTGISTDFIVGLLPLTSLLVDNRITNPNGFAQGSYETTTVVTCS